VPAVPIRLPIPPDTEANRAADRAQALKDYYAPKGCGTDLDVPKCFKINGVYYVPGAEERIASEVTDFIRYCFTCMSQLSSRDRDLCGGCGRLCFVECGTLKVAEGVDDWGNSYEVDHEPTFHCCVCYDIASLTVLHRERFEAMPSRSSQLAAASSALPAEPEGDDGSASSNSSGIATSSTKKGFLT
jgi:hypothetical protein